MSRYKRSTAWTALKRVRADVRNLSAAIPGPPIDILWNTGVDTTHARLRHFAKTKARGERLGPVLLVWAGHGTLFEKELGLVVHDTDEQPTSLDTISPAVLVEAALDAGAEQLLLVLDTCHSGAAVLSVARTAIDTLTNRSFPAGSEPWVGVLASTHAYARADDEQTIAALLARILSEGPRTRAWSAFDEYVDGGDLIDAIKSEWTSDQKLQELRYLAARAFAPNPFYDASASERRVQPVTLPVFVGRRRVLTTMCEWAHANATGALAIVGDAAIGKSALLERFATLSDPRRRPGLSRGYGTDARDLLPPEVDMVLGVVADGRSVESIVGALSRSAKVSETDDPLILAEELGRLDGSMLIVIDGIDEASRGGVPRIVSEVIRELASVARVLIATRPMEAGLGDGDLDELLGMYATVVDLAADPDLERDLREFVLELLEEGAS